MLKIGELRAGDRVVLVAEDDRLLGVVRKDSHPSRAVAVGPVAGERPVVELVDLPLGREGRLDVDRSTRGTRVVLGGHSITRGYPELGAVGKFHLHESVDKDDAILGPSLAVSDPSCPRFVCVLSNEHEAERLRCFSGSSLVRSPLPYPAVPASEGLASASKSGTIMDA